jgi:ubiquilin
MPLQIVIKPMNSGAAEFPVDVEPTATVQELKQQIAGRAGFPADHIRLVCAGRVWSDVSTVGSYAPAEGAKVHCLNNPPRTAPAASEQTLQQVDPLQQMMGGGMAAAPTPTGDPMQDMMAQAQHQMQQNPEMVRQMMSSPMVQQMMSDPETVRAMMRMNPQMNQLMEQRPEIARILEDPEMLQQSMRMAANPSLMREMIRNADRSIGNLDVMPGGHNALRRAHEEVADPLFDAMAGGQGETQGSLVAEYSQTTSGAPNSAPLANPWAAPAPAAAPAGASPTPAAQPAPAHPAGTPPMGQSGAAAPAANPMTQMMQQMMSNPQQMQHVQQMMQQMMSGAAAPPAGSPQATAQGGAAAPPTESAQATQQIQPATPAAAGVHQNPMMQMQQLRNNPMMQQMMQQMMADPQAMQQVHQMMSNPQAMQQVQQMMGGNPMMQQMFSNPQVMQHVQQMMGDPQAMQRAMQMMSGQHQGMPGGMPFGYGFGAQPGQFGSPGLGMPAEGAGGAAPTPAAGPMDDMMLRARFAHLLPQLTAMGFTNEALCLRVLQQQNGRLDAAIDVLLTSGDAVQ